MEFRKAVLTVTKKRKILSALIALLVIAVTALIIIIMPEVNMKSNLKDVTLYPAESFGADDRIYFLNTGSSDAILIESDGKYALIDAAEDRLAKEIGKVNLLKVGHHGYDGSTTKGYVEALSPELAVVTNREGGISRTPLSNLNSVKAAVLETGVYNGIVAEFGDEGIKVYRDLDSIL